ncbi:MAG: hypothetical protein KAS01_02425 [Candidatus Pacebacteria bacterium]|nr:hypothetical protein [Candidatus Paceibacterota bacterium]
MLLKSKQELIIVTIEIWSWILLITISLLVVIGLGLCIYVFYLDQKLISKAESESFEQGITLEIIELKTNIKNLEKEQKEHRKKFGRFHPSLQIAGEIYGFKKALRIKTETGENQ